MPRAAAAACLNLRSPLLAGLHSCLPPALASSCVRHVPSSSPSTLSVYYVLNTPPKGWAGGKGFVTADMIR